METLKRLTLIATLTGIFSGGWLGSLGWPSTIDSPQADAIVAVPAPPVMGILTSGPAVLTPLLDASSGESASAPLDDEDEAAPQTIPPRRGGGIGRNLKK